ncbi:cytochrome c [Arenibacter sp. GZD96]|uniref:c-type cytochrome n=1 Tax=Aurantibrevibacter litoralis TaxID=3106030 RepID=UPI002AFE0A6D|nr:cytochrome c [Arenibacter sp. GZD-96]MEA1786543.1 cytochrome c [Arenibacter sp. GZD-96]
MKTLNYVSLIGIVALVTLSFTPSVQEEWVVPAKFKTMKNPTDAKDKENLAIGKALYAKQCASCHGKKGWGDGPKAKEMKGDLGDFSAASTQKQTDGELYYKITEGRDDMPGFTKKIPSEEDRWLVVNYMRTLAK